MKWFPGDYRAWEVVLPVGVLLIELLLVVLFDSDVFTSARGVGNSPVEIIWKPASSASQVRRFALVLQRDMPDDLQGPAVWLPLREGFVPITGQQTQSVPCRFAFNSGWSWRGYRMQRFPYADSILVDYETSIGPVCRLFRIHWNSHNTDGQVIIPSVWSGSKP